MKAPWFRLLFPILGFVIPSLVIGYGVVLSRAGHTGMDELTIGFAGTLLGACMTYVAGIAITARHCR
jgi:hypothetical protein